MKQLQDVMVWLARDISKTRPTLTSTLFSGQMLSEAVNQVWGDGLLKEIMYNLEMLRLVIRTNKVGPDGDYFNIHPRFVQVFSPVRSNKIFVRRLKAPDEGFCLVMGKKKTYRLVCAGRKCKYYFAAEKKCVKNLFFVN